MEPPKAFLIIHADEVGWSSVRAIIRAMADCTITGDVLTATHALRTANEHPPDIILASAYLRDGSVLPVLQQLRDGPCTRSSIAIFATRLGTPRDLAAFASLSISGYFMWDDLSEALMRLALEAIICRHLSSCSDTPAQAVAAIIRGQVEPLPSLTTRQLNILQGLAQGLTEKELALALECSDRTVRREIEKLEEKLDARTQFQLGLHASRTGAIPLDQ